MFAYCLNNPLVHNDPNGTNPVLFAAAGGAIAGGLISMFFYLNNAGDEASFGGALLSVLGGVIAGALGGAASMLTGQPQLVCVLGAAIVSGLISDCTGGSFLVSSSAALVGTLLGLGIDISMYSGMELMFASLIASLGVGYPAEMASQAIHDTISQPQKGGECKSSPSNSTNKTTSSTTSGRRSVVGSRGHKSNHAYEFVCIY